jgi:hypothetical protein
VLYERWRQNRPDGPKTTVTMTGRTIQGQNGLAALLGEVRRSPDMFATTIKRTATWLTYWPAWATV